MKIKINTNTTLKKDHKKQAIDLPDELKYKVLKDEEFEIAAYKKEEAHWKFTLANGETLGGFNTWYCYDKHCSIDDPNNRTEGVKLYEYFKKKGYEWDESINLIGIKGVNPNFTLNSDKPDSFNDLIVVVKGTYPYEILGSFIATTDPGIFYTVKPLNPRGAAMLVPGQYKSWQYGFHRNYRALSQTGGKVTVNRDRNKNYRRDDKSLDTGYFGINIHHANNSNSVGRYSAGCQVIRNVSDFKGFLDLALTHPGYQRNKSFVFTYTLVVGKEIFK